MAPTTDSSLQDVTSTLQNPASRTKSTYEDESSPEKPRKYTSSANEDTTQKPVSSQAQIDYADTTNRYVETELPGAPGSISAVGDKDMIIDNEPTCSCDECNKILAEIFGEDMMPQDSRIGANIFGNIAQVNMTEETDDGNLVKDSGSRLGMFGNREMDADQTSGMATVADNLKDNTLYKDDFRSVLCYEVVLINQKEQEAESSPSDLDPRYTYDNLYDIDPEDNELTSTVDPKPSKVTDEKSVEPQMDANFKHAYDNSFQENTVTVEPNTAIDAGTLEMYRMLKVRDTKYEDTALGSKQIKFTPEDLDKMLYNESPYHENVYEASTVKATTAKQDEEKLAQKIEKIDETPVVEAGKTKVEGFNVAPKVLGKVEKVANFVDGNIDEVAKRCLKSPNNQIDEMLLREMEKLGIPLTGQKPIGGVKLDERVQSDFLNKSRKPSPKKDFELETHEVEKDPVVSRSGARQPRGSAETISEKPKPKVTEEISLGTKHLDPKHVLTCNETCPISPKPIMSANSLRRFDGAEVLFERDSVADQPKNKQNIRIPILEEGGYESPVMSAKSTSEKGSSNTPIATNDGGASKGTMKGSKGDSTDNEPSDPKAKEKAPDDTAGIDNSKASPKAEVANTMKAASAAMSAGVAGGAMTKNDPAITASIKPSDNFSLDSTTQPAEVETGNKDEAQDSSSTQTGTDTIKEEIRETEELIVRSLESASERLQATSENLHATSESLKVTTERLHLTSEILKATTEILGQESGLFKKTSKEKEQALQQENVMLMSEMSGPGITQASDPSSQNPSNPTDPTNPSINPTVMPSVAGSVFATKNPKAAPEQSEELEHERIATPTPDQNMSNQQELKEEPQAPATITEVENLAQQGLAEQNLAEQQVAASPAAEPEEKSSELTPLSDAENKLKLSELMRLVRERNRLMDSPHVLMNPNMAAKKIASPLSKPFHHNTPVWKTPYPELKPKPRICVPKKKDDSKKNCSSCDLATLGLHQQRSRDDVVFPSNIYQPEVSVTIANNMPPAADLTEEIILQLQALGNILGSAYQQGKAEALEAAMLAKTRHRSRFNRSKDYEPWIPIPSWPYTKKHERPKLQCPKDGCKMLPPPRSVYDPPYPHCGLKPCKTFPTFPKRTFSLLDYFTVALGDHKVVDLGEF